MKKLLLTTTALAAMTGAAVADVSWSGSGSINYKTADNGNEAAFTSDAELVASMSTGGAYAGSVSIKAAEHSTAADGTGTAGGAAVTVTMPMGTLTVSDHGGLADAASSYSKVTGMTGLPAAAVSTSDANTNVSVSANLGDISASFSSDTNLDSDNSSFGATGSLGGMDFTFGSANDDMGLSLSGAALGGTVKIAVEESGTESNSGVSIAIPLAGSTVTLNVADAAGDDTWSASVATTVNGASVTVGSNEAGTTTVDVTATIAGGASFVADFSTAANNSEYGVSYDLGGGATFLLSHSEFATKDDYALGTNMKLSFAF
jgi:hypothetical protein